MEPAAKAEIEKEFRKALPKARMMMTKNILSKEDVTKLYGLFQQASQGNCNDWKVFRNMNLVDLESKAKFTAWVSHRGLSKTEAMQKYSTEVDLMATKYCVVFPSSTFGPRFQFGSVASLATCTTMVPESDPGDGDDTASINSDVSLL